MPGLHSCCHIAPAPDGICCTVFESTKQDLRCLLARLWPFSCSTQQQVLQYAFDLSTRTGSLNLNQQPCWVSHREFPQLSTRVVSRVRIARSHADLHLVQRCSTICTGTSSSCMNRPAGRTWSPCASPAFPAALLVLLLLVLVQELGLRHPICCWIPQKHLPHRPVLVPTRKCSTACSVCCPNDALQLFDHLQLRSSIARTPWLLFNQYVCRHIAPMSTEKQQPSWISCHSDGDPSVERHPPAHPVGPRGDVWPHHNVVNGVMLQCNNYSEPLPTSLQPLRQCRGDIASPHSLRLRPGRGNKIKASVAIVMLTRQF